MAALWSCLWLPALLSAEEIDLGLWFAWGGGSARQWSGEIRFETDRVQPLRPTAGTATILDFQPVGLKPDEPGSMYADGSVLHVAPRSPRTYDAVSLSVRVPREATIAIRLAPGDAPETAQTVRVAVAKLLSETHNTGLDDRGNRLLVRRTPGDKLRISFARDSLVFAPGERFEFFVKPHLIESDPDSALTYAAQLTPARSETVLWKDEHEHRTDVRGDAPEAGPFTIPLPQEEGVYDVHFSLSKRRLPTRLAPAKTLYQRRVQLVVIDSRPASTVTSVAWQTVEEIKPEPDRGIGSDGSAKSKLRDSLAKLPHLKWPTLGGNEKREPVGNGQTRKRLFRDREFVEILPGGWQAYPLPVRQPNQPHVVEIEYPGDLPQTLAISILEPNGPPVGLDSGLDLPDGSASSVARIERHRLVYWPRTETPLLLLANRRDREPAVAGRIRVLAGPQQLPPRPTETPENPRLLAAYYSRPLLPENFSAGDVVDEVTGQSLKDWVTFHRAGQRFVQYLKYAGYNGAMVCVLHEGGALYPSRLLQPTPRYDNGVFFGTAQDAVRKDVLEMLFRLCDREGLRLVPALQFSAPLPELEAALRRQPLMGATGRLDDGDAAAGPTPTLATDDTGGPDGIELTGATGQSWRQQALSDRGVGPFYNPLDRRVQEAVRRVVDELTQRYGQHVSFGGVAVQLSPDTFTQLPDTGWGSDFATMRRFAEDEKLTVPGLHASDRRVMTAYLKGEGRDAWLRWRAAKLADFYKTLQTDVAAKTPAARLYLAGADMLTGPELRDTLTPRLPERLDVRLALLRVGVDPALYQDQAGLVLLRPHRLGPTSFASENAVQTTLSRSAELDQLFAVGATREQSPAGPGARPVVGSVFFHEPQPLTPDAFEQVNPFGRDKAVPWLMSHVSPAGHNSRQRFVHALATQDSHVLFDGGWMPVMGQEDAFAAVVDVYRRLPAEPFETVVPSGEEASHVPVVVRRRVVGNRTYLYLANDSPWPVSVAVEIGGSERLEVLGGRTLPAPVAQGNRLVWNLALLPYDLVGAVWPTADVKIADWRAQLGREAFAELRTSIDDIRRRATTLRDAQPLPALTNPGFELPPNGEQLTGWERARGDGIAIDLVTNPTQTGQCALRLRSRGPVAWVRSNPFPAPKTGRLHIWAWLRTNDPNEQPPLQVAVEGRLNGKPYYCPARVGAGFPPGDPKRLKETWAPFIVRVDDLPTAGVTDLRVAFDLMGPGDVSIDDVQVFDLWFDKTECNELLKSIALADLNLGKGSVTECRRLLEGYWPEFLRRHVAETPQMANVSRDPSTTATTPTPASKEDPDRPKASTSWLERLVPKPPKLPKLVR